MKKAPEKWHCPQCGTGYNPPGPKTKGIWCRHCQKIYMVVAEPYEEPKKTDSYEIGADMYIPKIWDEKFSKEFEKAVQDELKKSPTDAPDISLKNGSGHLSELRPRSNQIGLPSSLQALPSTSPVARSLSKTHISRQAKPSEDR